MYRDLKSRRYPSTVYHKNRHVPAARNRVKHRNMLLCCILLFAAFVFLLQQNNKAKSSLAASVDQPIKVVSSATETDRAVHLEVEPVIQNPELPNGCEATSLCAALNFFGFPADKLEIAYNYLPREDFIMEDDGYHAADPAEKYAGDPATSLGFYCFEAPIIQAANSYFQAQHAGLNAMDISGADSDGLKAYLAKGMPVVLWVTMDYSAQAEYHEDFQWVLPDGSIYTPYKNLHCVLLTGYDSSSFTVCDPLAGRLEILQETLLEAYSALGSHAASFDKPG